jgi:hypothetical protein
LPDDLVEIIVALEPETNADNPTLDTNSGCKLTGFADSWQ